MLRALISMLVVLFAASVAFATKAPVAKASTVVPSGTNGPAAALNPTTSQVHGANSGSGTATAPAQGAAKSNLHTPRLTPPRPPGSRAAIIAGPLFNNGGPVESAPVVYVDYWGWTSDPSGEAAYLNRFLSSVGGTPWLNTVTQYGGGNPSVLFGGSWSDPAAIPAQPTDGQVQSEAASAARHFGLGTSVNVEIVVATPTGHATVGFGTQYCAYHGAVASNPNITYTDLPYLTDAGTSCGAYSVNGNLDGVSIVEGHELAETITDPLLNAWYDASGNEIGDKCAWSNLADITTTNGTFAMQPLWSNADNGCVMSYVQNRPLDHVVLSPSTATVTAGTPQPYVATGFDAYGNSLGDVTAATTLSIAPSGTGTGASCNNATHTCTATQAGTYSITGSDGPVSGTAGLTITSPPPSFFTLRPGLGVDVGAGSNGSVWIVGTNPVPGGYGIYRWSGSGWTAIPGGAVRIAVDPSGNPWVVNSTGHIYHWVGNSWTSYPGLASDIGVGANGSVWIVGTNPVPGGYGIYRWSGSGWAAIPGGAVRIAVGPAGNPWVVNSTGHVYHWVGNGWSLYPGLATDIGVGANGSVWIVGTNPVAGGYGIYQWTGGVWASVAGGAVGLSVGPSGNPWIVDSARRIYSS